MRDNLMKNGEYSMLIPTTANFGGVFLIGIIREENPETC